MEKNLKELQKRIGYQFKNESRLEKSLTHRSASKENNERLEYLGDSFLNFVVASELFKIFPKAREGQMSRLRANMVREETLADIARDFSLHEFIKLGVGEMKSGGAFRDSILADAIEAIIGAMYLDQGMSDCYEVVERWYHERLLELSLNDVFKDPKSRLQELLQAQQMPLPEYRIVETRGEEHNQIFIVGCKTALLEHEVMAEGTSRRRAEQQAAESVLKELKHG